jgi:hypothetical protein
MKVKLASFFLTLLINIAVGVVIFFFMLLAMNGFSETDAEYGLAAYIILALLVSLVMSVGAALTVPFLMKRQFHSAIAVLIIVPAFSIAGALLKIACSIIGVLIADYVRVNS